MPPRCVRARDMLRVDATCYAIDAPAAAMPDILPPCFFYCLPCHCCAAAAAALPLMLRYDDNTECVSAMPCHAAAFDCCRRFCLLYACRR